jgi:hypothetical protein
MGKPPLAQAHALNDGARSIKQGHSDPRRLKISGKDALDQVDRNGAAREGREKPDNLKLL